MLCGLCAPPIENPWSKNEYSYSNLEDTQKFKGIQT